MAFIKYAKAQIQKPGIQFAEWAALRSKAISPAPDFQRRTAKVILDEYDPSKYMLSHATIVASVDTVDAPAKLGKHYEDGFEVDRRFRNYYITPETAGLVNNNNDSFERKLLLASYKTFVGAQSYVEHVQIPELSKGRIIDAAARDIGNSVYVDILIANELKHKPLIDAIKSGKLGTLSMGCSTSYCQCSKCGNVATDETTMCPCIRYFKGTTFLDEKGVERKVAELCGHHTAPESVKFIEASWVANPAFKGAVLRNILSPEEAKEKAQKVHLAFQLPESAPMLQGLSKAARYILADQEVPEGIEEAAEAAEQDQSTQDEAQEEAEPKVQETPVAPKKPEKVIDSEANNRNDTLIKSALQHPEWKSIATQVIKLASGDKKVAKKIFLGLILHRAGGWSRVASEGFTGKERLGVNRALDVIVKKSTLAGETRLYKVAVDVGGRAPYRSDEAYLAACRQISGRVLTGSEVSKLLELGKLL